MKKRFTKAVTITATAMLIGTMPFTATGVLAGEKYPAIATYNDIATPQTTINDKLETASSEVVVPVTVSSDAWNYTESSRVYGTWKELDIKVGDKMYELSKSNAVDVTFRNGDVVKVYAGDSYELGEGTVSISGDVIYVNNFSSKTNWGCNLTYSTDTGMVLEKKKDRNFGGGVAYGNHKIFYSYDLNAKTEIGAPVEGVSVVEEETYSNRYFWDEMIWSGYVQNHSTWGNGNSFDVETRNINDEQKYIIKSTRVTDKNGLIDMYLPEEVKQSNEDFNENIYIGGDIYANLQEVGKKKVFVSNGLVDVTINDEYYASTTSLGLSAKFNTIYTDKILGDCYYFSDKLEDTKSNSVTIKDTSGNDIAVVTMGVKETENAHLVGKDDNDDYNYKATGFEPTVDVKMADGVMGWEVSVTTDDDTFHINVVEKQVNSSNSSQVKPSDKLNGLNQAEDGNWYYYVDNNVDTSYTGLANNKFGWWYINNGTVDFNCNTLVEYNGAWWKVENGQVNFDSNTVAEFNGAWWKITNGAVDFGFTGLASNEFGWWYISGGQVDFNYNGVVENETGWWKVTNGAVDFEYNGVAENDFGWWKITNGSVDFNYTGLANNKFGWWYISNGAVDFNCNTLVEFNGNWWKVENGQVNFDSNTVCEFNGAWWKITNGAVDFGFTGLANNDLGWWYINNGQVDFNYTGTAENEAGTWNVVNGQVVF